MKQSIPDALVTKENGKRGKAGILHLPGVLLNLQNHRTMKCPYIIYKI
jgi:hypothetical protein